MLQVCLPQAEAKKASIGSLQQEGHRLDRKGLSGSLNSKEGAGEERQEASLGGSGEMLQLKIEEQRRHLDATSLFEPSRWPLPLP